MNRLLPLLFILLISGSIRQAAAQTSAPAVPAKVAPTKVAQAPVVPEVIDPSLKGQYEALLSKSKTYYTYKLINPVRLTAFYRSVADSIRKERVSSRSAQAKITAQARTIDTLNSQIKGNESSLESTNAKVNEISFLGIPFSKTTYNTLVWSIIIVLALALAFVVIRSAKNIHEAKYRTELYEEVSKEYQTFKVKANEKEKKLARELQDERNKLDELRTRGI
ncbi:MAG: hypothetical protein MUP99_03415 [Pedobacter sp.]|nr:hypothetical protein [Pedobacter sp.]